MNSPEAFCPDCGLTDAHTDICKLRSTTPKPELNVEAAARKITDLIGNATSENVNLIDGDLYVHIPGPRDGLGQHYDPSNININRDILALTQQVSDQYAEERAKVELDRAIQDCTWADSVEQLKEMLVNRLAALNQREPGK